MSAELFFLLILSAVVIVLLPLGYFAAIGRADQMRAVLVVSTDDSTRAQVAAAAKAVDYRCISVYRYEDALDTLRADGRGAQNDQVEMILIDDSVPASEAGLLVAMMKQDLQDVLPLILITDASEDGLTAPSYRADMVLARPVDTFVLQEAIQAIRRKLEREL